MDQGNSQLTRRSMLTAMPIAGLAILEVGCKPADAAQFVTVLNQITFGIQSALPIIDLFVPPPYNALEPAVATFLNLLTTATGQAAMTLADASLTATQQAQAVIKAYAGVILDPSVIQRLPTNLQGPNGPINTQQLIVSLVNLTNSLLAQLAVSIQAPVTPAASNAIVVVQVPATAARATGGKKLSLSGDDKAKLGQIQTMTAQFHARLAAH